MKAWRTRRSPGAILGPFRCGPMDGAAMSCLVACGNREPVLGLGWEHYILTDRSFRIRIDRKP